MVRLKHRYLLFNILYPTVTTLSLSSPSSALQPQHLKFHGPTPQHITPQLFIGHLRSQIASLFGDHGVGVSLASLKLIYFSHATSTVILRVPRSYYRITWATLSLMNELPAPRHQAAQTIKCVVRVVRVSGTIRKAEDELLRRSRREVVRVKMLAEDKQNEVLQRLTGAVDNDSVLQPDALDAGVEDDEDEVETE